MEISLQVCFIMWNEHEQFGPGHAPIWVRTIFIFQSIISFRVKNIEVRKLQEHQEAIAQKSNGRSLHNYRAILLLRIKRVLDY